MPNVPKRFPRGEEPGPDGANRYIKHRGEFRIGVPLDFTQPEKSPLFGA